MHFQIDNMACGGCASSVIKAIHTVDPEAKVDIDLDLKKISVQSNADEAALVAVLGNAGYPTRSLPV